MKILITGGTGFIGSNLVRYLSDRDHYLYCLHRCGNGYSNTNSSNKDNKNSSKISYIQHDLSNVINIDKLPSDIDCIIHLAVNVDKTIDRLKFFQVNTVSALNLLEYGRSIGIKRFIFSSSGNVYGYNEKPSNELTTINPIDFYGITKYESELLVNHYSQYFSTIILRLFFPYGYDHKYGQKKGLFHTLVDKIKNNEPITICNNENPKINPMHITDLVNIIDRSIFLDGNNTLNVAGDEIVSIKELASLIGVRIGIEPIFEYINDSTISNLIGDNTKMKDILKLETDMVRITQGLSQLELR